MNDNEEPSRLKDQAGVSGALLRAATPVPGMSDEDRAAILVGLGAATTATSTTAASAAETTSAVGAGTEASATAGALAGKAPLLAGIASVVLGGAVAAFVLTRPPPAPPPTIASSLPAPNAANTAPVVEEPAPAPSTAAEPPVVTAPVATMAAPATTHAHASASVSGNTASSLAAESALIGKARGLLEASPESSLALLDEHRHRHPRGELASERDFLTIKALRRLGRAAEARERARAYPGRYPSSPYTPAVQGILADLGGP